MAATASKSELRHLLDKIDNLVLQLLPEEGATDRADSTGQPGLHLQARELVGAVGQLEAAFEAFARAPPQGELEAAEQEVKQLEAELQAADTLLESCDSKVQHWQGQCQQLASMHAKSLRSGIS